jgi:prephenate dehydratase
MKTSLQVAIQGDPASFHEIAANNYYAQPIELIYCQSFEETFGQLLSGDADRAFVATSNSAHGEITAVKDLLIKNGVQKEGEHRQRIEQHLIGLPGTDIHSVRQVVSHPVALSQCDLYLADFDTREYHDTSAAVEYVKLSGNPALAAVGSSAAAELHGLEILQASIQNDPNNVTTFASVVIAPSQEKR